MSIKKIDLILVIICTGLITGILSASNDIKRIQQINVLKGQIEFLKNACK